MEKWEVYLLAGIVYIVVVVIKILWVYRKPLKRNYYDRSNRMVIIHKDGSEFDYQGDRRALVVDWDTVKEVKEY